MLWGVAIPQDSYLNLAAAPYVLVSVRESGTGSQGRGLASCHPHMVFALAWRMTILSSAVS